MIFLQNGRRNVTMFGRVKHRRGAWHSGRCIEDHLLLYISEGTVCMKIGDETFTAHCGDFLFIPARTPYRPLASGACEYYAFHFEQAEVKSEMTPSPGVSALEEDCEGFAYVFDRASEGTVKLDTHFTPLYTQAIREIFLRAEQLDVLHDARAKMRLDLYFGELLMTIAETDGAGTGLVNQITNYISEHIRTPLSLRGLSHAFYMSESYIARLFKREMHESVGNYIQKQKMRLACAMLIDTDLSIAEIARQIGYANQYYFSHTFSKATGMSPTAYRKRM